MPLVEVTDVTILPPDYAVVRGWGIDSPKVGQSADRRALELIGWALGNHERPVIAIELVHDGNVFRRLTTGIERPDLAEGFPNVYGADRAGFRATIAAPGTQELAFEMRVVLSDQTRLPMAQISARWDWRNATEVDASGTEHLVSIVIPCFNHARYLAEAIESALAQTYPHIEVIVVDDGSSDNTHTIAARYPGVRYVRQANAGLSAARNAGIRQSSGAFLNFLDADDRLLPNAIESGMRAMQSGSGVAMTFGRFRLIDLEGKSGVEWPQDPLGRDAYETLLRGNTIAMHATVLYRRSVFDSVGVFDESLHACEDYDLYLRAARQFPIAAHDTLVAEYRRHGMNMSEDPARMLRSAVTVLRRQQPYVGGTVRAEAMRDGLRYWRNQYGRPLAGAVRERVAAGQWRAAWAGARALIGADPTRLAQVVRGTSSNGHLADHGSRVARAAPSPHVPAVGRVHFGDLRRLAPLSSNFGYDRGNPIDRYYVEGFLASHQTDVRGRVLEVSQNVYTKRFGGDRVTQGDVISLEEGNADATIVGDLACAEHIPSDAFDCAIITQTLHLIYDTRAALRTLYRILKPGGVLLLTAPGITPLEFADAWHWTFTPLSMRKLLEEVFGGSQVQIESFGNVLAASSFLYGLATQELSHAELDRHDPRFLVTVAARAVKPAADRAEGSGDAK